MPQPPVRPPSSRILCGNQYIPQAPADMANAIDISNAEIRHRAEQYVVVITESIRDVNRELQDQKANKRRHLPLWCHDCMFS